MTRLAWQELPAPHGGVAALVQLQRWRILVRPAAEVDEKLRALDLRPRKLKGYTTFVVPVSLCDLAAREIQGLTEIIRVKHPEWISWIQRERQLHQQRALFASILTDLAAVDDPTAAVELINHLPSALDYPVVNELYGYQRAGLAWLRLAHGRAILGDDMGLGKTPQACVFLETSEQSRRALVVSPTSVAINWTQEGARWAPSWRFHVAKTMRLLKIALRKLANSDEQRVAFVVTWGMLHRCIDELAAADFDNVIADEAHYAKNLDSQRSTALLELCHRAERRLLLTGTYVRSRTCEIWPLLHMVDPLGDRLKTFIPFGEQYCGPRWRKVQGGTRVRTYRGKSRIPQLNLVTRAYALRRMKVDVLPQIPVKRIQKLFIQPTQHFSVNYQCVLNQFKQTDGEDRSTDALGMLEKLRCEVGLAKVPAAIEWLTNAVASGEQVVTFFTHQQVHAALVAGLNTAGIRHASIVGATSKTQRQKITKTFQSGELDVLLGSEAAKEGITLTAARFTLHVERWWVPGDESQAMDRICRIGQTRGVLCVFLHLVGSLDDHIDQLIDCKQQTIDEVNDRTSIHGVLLRRLISS